ncbi:MarR family winged helix-turn-helix transcriptional regulator [Roseobacter sp. MH60115]|uniref:MarR family winged helix-turn-helix transcriptional regulator n=1 Tax=Roseobacter sp. MH60115 TaxID=2785324 RepID=UPI001E3802DA|nr:MarR family winged helix-turn-helix transcriptional regulator [Roseobacter sp. MH60115]
MTDAAPSEMPRSEFHMREWPFYWIIRVNSRYFQAMEKALKPLGLDLPNWRVVMALYEGKHLSVSEIADLCVIRLNTTTKIIQRMRTDGLVTTRPRKSDGRVTEVTLTANGEQLRHKGWAVAEKMLERAFGGIPQSERQALNATLEKVFDRLAD